MHDYLVQGTVHLDIPMDLARFMRPLGRRFAIATQGISAQAVLANPWRAPAGCSWYRPAPHGWTTGPESSSTPHPTTTGDCNPKPSRACWC